MNPHPAKKRNRKSIRLKGYDYSQEGLYFITICCQDRKHRFGEIANGIMKLNEYGTIAHNEWINLSHRFPNFELDAFQIMPNHMHAIINLLPNDTVRAPLAGALYENENNDETGNELGTQYNDIPIIMNNRAGTSPAPTDMTDASISDIIGAYKSLVSNECLKIYKSKNKTMGKIWQRNYYEHIIRDDRAYQNISNYIVNNPSKWEADKFYR